MGLVDLVYVIDERCVCSEGHSLNGEGFETKDLGCTMGTAHIAAGRLTFEPGDWGRDAASSPVTARIWMCTFCPQCPRFKTKWGMVEHLVAFVVMVERGAVTSMERVSQPLSEWLQEEHVREAAAQGVDVTDPYRTPGRIDPPQGWTKCATCPGFLSPWHNARRTPKGIVCIPCWEKLGRP